MQALLKYNNNPSEFFLSLYRLWRDEYQKQEKKLPELIIKMNKENGVDFCQVAVDAMNDNFRCFDVPPILEDALPDMNLNIDSVLSLSESLFQGMQGDLLAPKQFKPFENLIVKQPEFSRELLSELLNQDKPFIVGYVSRLFQGFARGNEVQIHEELCTLKDHKSKHVLMAIADVLGELDYTAAENRKLIPKTLSILDYLENKNLAEVNRIIVFAYTSLLKFSEIPKDKLIKFSKSDQVLLQGAVSCSLFRLQEEHGNEEWFSTALLKLSSVSCQYKGIMDDLDYVLGGLVEKNDNWDLAEAFLVEWLLNSDYTSNTKNLSDLLNSTFSAFIQKRVHLEKLLTRFFNHDNFKMHSAAAQIISFCQLQNINDLKLHKESLKLLAYADCLYICRKVLGYVNTPQYLCSLCFSVLDAFPRKKDMQDLIYTIFRYHIGENHPGRTLEFLKNVLSETQSVNKKKVVSQIIKDIESYLAQRDSLPILKELVPSRQKSKKVYRESSKKMSKAMEEAQQNSFVSLIASKVILKQGTGSFQFMYGAYSEITKMGQFSEEIELPHSEITHPVDAALERINFRLAKRGD